jgi:hypothetical protein
LSVDRGGASRLPLFATVLIAIASAGLLRSVLV